MREPAAQTWPMLKLETCVSIMLRLENHSCLQDSMCRPLDRLLDIGVVKDDGGTLSSKLERDILQIGFRCCLQNLSSSQCAPSERDLVYFGMLRDGLADRRA